MTRKDAIAYARIAGYHNDSAEFARLFCENRVSRKLMDDAWHNGETAKRNGMKCNCTKCKGN